MGQGNQPCSAIPRLVFSWRFTIFLKSIFLLFRHSHTSSFDCKKKTQFKYIQDCMLDKKEKILVPQINCYHKIIFWHLTLFFTSLVYMHIHRSKPKSSKKDFKLLCHSIFKSTSKCCNQEVNGFSVT